MRDMTDVNKFLLANGVSKKLLEILEIYTSVLPLGQELFSDKWDVIEWVPRPGNLKFFLLHFDLIENLSLRLCTKIFVLSKRFSKKIYGETAVGYIYAISKLSLEVGSKSLSELTIEDFYATEKSLKNYADSGFMYLKTLQVFSGWLCLNFNPALEYVAPNSQKTDHGRNGNDKGRAKKLLPDEVVSQLFRIANAPDMDEKNRFFLNAFVLDTVMQGRINELATLPNECLIEVSGSTAIKVFSEKGGLLGVRHFPQVLAPAVKEAVSYIQSQTEEGRALVKRLKQSSREDWYAILDDDLALRYFTKKFVSEWTMTYRLLDDDAVWSNSLSRTINAIDTLREFDGSYRLASASLNITNSNMRQLVRKQQAARRGEYLVYTSGVMRVLICDDQCWRIIARKNPLAIGFDRMRTCLEIESSNALDKISDILDAGLLCQMERKVYPMPDYNSLMERKFAEKIRPVVVTRNGRVVLEPEDALFVVPRNFLNSFKTRSNRYQLISDEVFTRWLSAQAGNTDSIFHRYDIRDPRTGGIAEFTWHDIRHWFQTVLKRGGLTDAQAGLLAGRKQLDQTRVYDHTPAMARSQQLANMRDGIKNGSIIGRTTETYEKLRVEDSVLAEEYLIASTLVVNSMPHGGCTLNLALTPCIHHLSCFSSGVDGNPCNHLQVNTADQNQITQIVKLHKQALAMIDKIIDMGGEVSPQYEHYIKVVESTGKFISLSHDVNKDQQG